MFESLRLNSAIFSQEQEEIHSYEEAKTKGRLHEFVFGKEIFRGRNATADSSNALTLLIEQGALKQLKSGNLFFFDPSDSADQCHLTALRVAEIYTRFKEDPEKLTGEDKRFLILCFLVSNVFRKSVNQMIDVLHPRSKKEAGRLKNFVNLCSIEALSQLHKSMRQFTRESLSLTRELGSEISSELSTLHESLHLGKTRRGFVRFPKFAGVILLMDRMKEQNFSFVFKIRVLCGKGFHSVTIARLMGDKIEDQAVLVVEGVALNNGLSFEQYKVMREDQPGLFGKGKASPFSACSDGGACLIAQKHLKQFGELSAEQLLLAAGADFSSQMQKEDVQRFFSQKGEDSLHNLADLFDKHSNEASTLKVSVESPQLFVVEHLIPDTRKAALTDSRLLDTTPEKLIEARCSHE